MSAAVPFDRFRSFPPLGDGNALPKGPVLVFAPHPDDEVIGCGGALCFHASRGDRVQVVQVTGGERGDPAALEHGALVDVRAQETREALAVLGVEDVVSLQLADGAVEPDETTIARFAEVLAKHAPVLVYAPSPLECHPDHLATSYAAAAAALRAAPAAELLLYEINHPTLATVLYDITPHVAALRESLSCYRSQLRYQDIVGKVLAAAYARTVNIELPQVQYAEAYLRTTPAHFSEVWAAARIFSRVAEAAARRGAGA